MHRLATWALVITTMAVAAMATAQQATELKVMQQPTFWIVGQWTRILIETPADCGELQIAHPDELTLVDRWPHTPGDTVQRFYLRATEPLDAGEIVFSAGNYTLTMPVRVLSWGQVLTERFEAPLNPPGAETRGGINWGDTLTLPRLFPMEGEDEPMLSPGYLTAEELERQREGFRANFRGQAEQNLHLAEDLEKLFHHIPESTIPRAVYVNNPVYQAHPDPAKGCPVCGEKVFEGRSAFYPWVLDRENRPFQVQCPECERWFPSNDFAAGDMTSGEFPDDGWGYFDDEGRPYSFVGYYLLQNYRGGDRRADEFSRYYLASDDRRWARATAVVLFRVAEQYLNLALNINQRERYMRDNLWRGTITPQGTPPPSYASYFSPGFYLDAVWSVGLNRFYAEALERIWDYFDEEDPELIAFLQQHHHPHIQSMEDVRNFIETGYFRTVAQGILDYSIAGNGPAEHAMAMDLALTLNTPRSIELADWVFNNTTHGMHYYLTNRFFVDGSGYESPGYNNAHYGGTISISEMVSKLAELQPEAYEAADLPLLADDPKFKYMFDHNMNLSLISRTRPYVGDDGDLARTDPLPLRPGAALATGRWVNAFANWPEEINYARALWDAEANAPGRHVTDPDMRAAITEIIEREGPYLDLPSQVLDGFGHVVLRSGEEDDQRALWMRYGTMYGHMHHDVLTIGFEALRRTLLPEQGYNRGPDHRTEWCMNWAIHYCGRIVGASAEPEDSWGRQGRSGGSLSLFGDGGWAQVATAARRLYHNRPAPELVELTDDMLVERTIGLVDIDEQHSYVVSIFRMTGGTDHYLSFHGPRGIAEPEGLQLTAQPTGTLAGPDVLYGIKWDSEWSKQNPHIMAFPFLDNVQRASPQAPWNLEWTLKNYPDAHLRLHGSGPAGSEVALAKGRPPGGGDPYELQWVMRHSQGAEPLASQFVEVLEAYEGAPLMTEIRPLHVVGGNVEQPPVALQVVLGDRVDTIIHCPDPGVQITTENGITMTGSFGVWSEEGGQLQRVFLAGGTSIGKGDRQFTVDMPAWTGSIVSADFANHTIVVDAGHEDPEALVGRYVRITNPLGNDRHHLVMAARQVPEGVALTLEWDPRIGEGPVQEVHEDGLTSAVELFFGRGDLYYRGKTLANEDGSATYRLNGVADSRRVYVNTSAHPQVSAEALAAEFTDRTGDGVANFFIYDYGPGETVTLPTVMSRTAADGTL